MSFWSTFIASLILLAFAFVGLLIGYILTGKPRIKRGTCGYDPTKQKDKDCKGQKNCALCSSKKK